VYLDLSSNNDEALLNTTFHAIEKTGGSGGLSWLNAGLQRLVVDPEGCGVGKGVARLPLQSRVGADQRASATHQQGLELWGERG
jgi:hypothetical protein